MLRISDVPGAAVAAGLSSLLTACAIGGPSGPGPTATARLEASKGSTTMGVATFTQMGDKVLVTAELSGLRPNTDHGFHVHEKGDCSSGDGMSAGGHFNPLAKPHAHNTTNRHVGDMPNIRADANGRASYRTELDLMTVTDGPTSIVGKGLIVHRDPDDYATQPTGNSGARIACGVIQRG